MQSPAWISRWKARHSFKLEITLVITIKALLLYGLWIFFFSHPLQDHLNDRLMTEHLLAGPSSVNIQVLSDGLEKENA